VLVLWALGGPTRPYKAKISLRKDGKDYAYYIRKATSTIRAKGADEAVVNAVYHRGYDTREPVEIRLERNELMVISYPGPDRSVRLEQLRVGRAQPRRYRNRRIGEFLKELEFTEGRCTGIPKIIEAMEKNGSPPAEFEFDEDHSYFMVRLPIHPTALEVAESVTGTTPIPSAKVGTGTKSGPSRDQVEILRKCLTDRPISDLMTIAARTNRTKFRDQVLKPLLAVGLLEMTIPEKPTSSKQRYRTTEKGRVVLAAIGEGGA